MALHHRSDCPLNRAIEILGDRWSLLVLRDVGCAGDAHFRALLGGSAEGISASVLADRLQALVAHGVLAREPCPGHSQKRTYRLTEAGRDLAPVLQALADWGRRYCGDDVTGTPPSGRPADRATAVASA